jgi:hypothetical protein
MNAQSVRKLVESQIGDSWSTTNHHGVDLRTAVVTPQKITVIERTVRNGKLRDHLVNVWLVLIENPELETGYRIVLRDTDKMFGLASEGFPGDERLVLCGWYGDFISTFEGM